MRDADDLTFSFGAIVFVFGLQCMVGVVVDDNCNTRGSVAAVVLARRSEGKRKRISGSADLIISSSY